MKQTDIYNQITTQLIEILDTHKNLNFSCNWTPPEIFAKNVITGRHYNGFNQIYLSFEAAKHYNFNRWITFLQGKSVKAHVKKGEQSRLVTFWTKKYYDKRTQLDVTEKVKSILERKEKLPDHIREVGLLRYYNVFNVEQFENLPEKFFTPDINPEFSESEKDIKSEFFINQTGATIEYKNGNNCYYLPRQDKIVLCRPEQFKGTEAYYSVLINELGHWTGHTNRLNRDQIHNFGTKE
jgi:antirestriction protein ArdC